MAASSLFGPDVDILMWDSGMTEKSQPAIDLLARQAIVGGIKVPILWNIQPEIAQALHNHADIDVGFKSIINPNQMGIPKAETYDNLSHIPYALRYMNCGNDIEKDVCKHQEWLGICWLERSDYTPTTKQDVHPGGRASWHPGFRQHQLDARILAFTLLQASEEALDVWMQTENNVLPEQTWHVTDYYENMKSEIRNLDPSIGKCFNVNGTLPLGFCKYPIKVS